MARTTKRKSSGSENQTSSSAKIFGMVIRIANTKKHAFYRVFWVSVVAKTKPSFYHFWLVFTTTLQASCALTRLRDSPALKEPNPTSKSLEMMRIVAAWISRSFRSCGRPNKASFHSPSRPIIPKDYDLPRGIFNDEKRTLHCARNHGRNFWPGVFGD